MDPLHAGILLLLACSAYSYQFRGRAGYGPFVQDPEREWNRLAKLISEETTEAHVPETKLRSSSKSVAIPEARKVPQYLVVSRSEDQKALLRPEKGSRPLPDSLKTLLLKIPVTTEATVTVRPNMVEILCHVDRIYARIRKELFNPKDVSKYLKLGTCPVNEENDVHYYFLYYLRSNCGFTKESKEDYRYVSNMLSFKPTSTFIRSVPFDVHLQCKYPRFFHSYKVGFYPKLQGGTVFKALQPKSSFTLTPVDASGNEVTGSKAYTLGTPMYFEAKLADGTASGNKRMYINKCFISASQDSNSNPKYTVIDNQGCMVDGKISDQSKFLTGSSKTTLKFSIGAMVLKDKASPSTTQQLYMHCDIMMSQNTPTPNAKACSYCRATKKWKELYGDDSVCTCCEMTCPSVQSKASRNVVSSHSWKVNLSQKDVYDELEPQMKFLDADMEDQDFLEHWKDD